MSVKRYARFSSGRRCVYIPARCRDIIIEQCDRVDKLDR